MIGQHLVPDILEPLPRLAHAIHRHRRDRLDAGIALDLRRDTEVAHAVLHASARSMIHARHRAAFRSEEHTSELQSLMRISYAVFRLKKKDTIPVARPQHVLTTTILRMKDNLQTTHLQ